MDWRMPAVDELMTLVYCSDGKYDTDGYCTNYLSVSTPTINSAYFPNTLIGDYWSSSTDADDSSSAWGVYFLSGYSFNYGVKNGNSFVRLVR